MRLSATSCLFSLLVLVNLPYWVGVCVILLPLPQLLEPTLLTLSCNAYSCVRVNARHAWCSHDVIINAIPYAVDHTTRRLPLNLYCKLCRTSSLSPRLSACFCLDSMAKIRGFTPCLRSTLNALQRVGMLSYLLVSLISSHSCRPISSHSCRALPRRWPVNQSSSAPFLMGSFSPANGSIGVSDQLSYLVQ